jgi:hypothetical protein
MPPNVTPIMALRAVSFDNHLLRIRALSTLLTVLHELRSPKEAASPLAFSSFSSGECSSPRSSSNLKSSSEKRRFFCSY